MLFGCQNIRIESSWPKCLVRKWAYLQKQKENSCETVTREGRGLSCLLLEAYAQSGGGFPDPLPPGCLWRGVLWGRDLLQVLTWAKNGTKEALSLPYRKPQPNGKLNLSTCLMRKIKRCRQKTPLHRTSAKRQVQRGMRWVIHVGEDGEAERSCDFTNTCPCIHPWVPSVYQWMLPAASTQVQAAFLFPLDRLWKLEQLLREAQAMGGRTKSEAESFDSKNKALSSDICILVCGPGSFIYCKVLRKPGV